MEQYIGPYVEKVIHQKHAAQMMAHQVRYGRLGQLQTPTQKRALKEDLARETRRKPQDRLPKQPRKKP